MPPRLAEKLLEWLIRDELAEEVLGDLEEKFYMRLEEHSLFRARLNYWYQTLNYLRPFALRGRRALHSNQFSMFQHYFKVANRNLIRQKMYSSIKIGGFALGIAACLLIALFIQDESKIDAGIEDTDRIFRFIGVSSAPGQEGAGTPFPAPIASVMRNDYPEIESVGRLIAFDWFDAGDNQFRPIEEEQNRYEDGFGYMDPELLEILSIPMVYGEQATALSEPNTLVISRSKAQKYFPNKNPIGKVVILNENKENPYTIGGVMEDIKENTHLPFDFILTLSGKEFWKGEQSSWCCWNYDSYIRLREGVDHKEFEVKLSSIIDNYMIPYDKAQGSVDADEMKTFFSFTLQPVNEVYLKSADIHDNIRHGDIRVVWLFGAIAGFILLLACINFINLSTAKSANRAKEVGLRKVVGSHRSDIVRQFLAESVVFSGISFVLGLVLAWLALPSFNILANKSLSFPWAAWWLIPLVLSAALAIGVLAGLYPALYLSGFRPIEVLKGKLSQGSKSSGMRSVMVIFQFATSIVLIICTFISYQQMTYILNKKVGFDKDQVIMIQGADTMEEKREAFKSEVKNLAQVKNATVSHYLPVSGTKRDFNSFWKEGRDKLDKSVSAQKWQVDTDYIETLGINLVEGRNFSHEIASDSGAIIINQTMAEKLGLQEPIGARIQNWEHYTVIGLVEDFHFESMKGEIVPLAMVLTDFGSIISIKAQSDDMAGTLAAIEAVWDRFMPNQPLRYTFLDQRYEMMYEDVQRTSKVLMVFATLAIIVACLGLFALSAFMVEQRSKEIGIRKVLGASLANIFNLLTVDFIKLVLIAMVIAMPVGWYLMQEWLQDYAYRIDISWEVFLFSGGLALLIALLTISTESLKAAMANPVDSIQNE